MYNLGKWPDENKTGGFALKASGAEATSTTGTSYELGKGKYRIVMAVTGCEVDTGDEFYNITLEASTRAASSTYFKIASLGCWGCAALTSDTVTPSTGGTYEMIVDNPYDYYVRVHSYIRGTFGTGITYSVTAYPLSTKV